MTLTSAISILARVHTRPRPYGIDADDPRSFEVIVGAEADPFINPGISRSDYIEAWSVLRENAGLMPEARPNDRIERLLDTLRELKGITPKHYIREHAIIDAAVSNSNG